MVVRGAGLGLVVKVALAAVPSATPSALRALGPTVVTTFASYGSVAAGSKTRTVSSSANRMVPATRLPSTRTLNAFFVEARSIGCVNRTEISATRVTSPVPARGRNRTTPGAATVRIAIDTGATSRPAASRTPSTISRYRVSGASGRVGTNVYVATPFAVTRESAPTAGGSRRIASATLPMSTAWSKATVNDESIATRFSTRSVAATAAEAASRVRNAARAGRVIGRPLEASAPGPTEMV